MNANEMGLGCATHKCVSVCAEVGVGRGRKGL